MLTELDTSNRRKSFNSLAGPFHQPLRPFLRYCWSRHLTDHLQRSLLVTHSFHQIRAVLSEEIRKLNLNEFVIFPSSLILVHTSPFNQNLRYWLVPSGYHSSCQYNFWKTKTRVSFQKTRAAKRQGYLLQKQ